MIIKRLENQTDKTTIFDHVKKKRLFTFEDGIFDTDDSYIISFWNKYYLGSGDALDGKHGDEEKPKAKKRGRPKKSVE